MERNQKIETDTTKQLASGVRRPKIVTCSKCKKNVIVEETFFLKGQYICNKCKNE